MGLDIIALENVELVRADGAEEGPHDDEGEDLVYLYPNPDFAERADGMVPGAYRGKGGRHEFRAGSYSGYSEWRERLAALVDTTPEKVWAGAVAPAFGELINFAVNEGTIGPKTSAKLAKDFEAWRSQAETWAKAMPGEEGAWFMRSYDDWRKAFGLAANAGAVQFC